MGGGGGGVGGVFRAAHNPYCINMGVSNRGFYGMAKRSCQYFFSHVEMRPLLPILDVLCRMRLKCIAQ